MRTMAALTAISLAAVLSSGSQVWGRQHSQVIIGDGFTYGGRAMIVTPGSQTVIIERPSFGRPFVERRFFAGPPIIVEKPVIIERQLFVPRQEFFFLDGFGWPLP